MLDTWRRSSMVVLRPRLPLLLLVLVCVLTPYVVVHAAPNHINNNEEVEIAQSQLELANAEADALELANDQTLNQLLTDTAPQVPSVNPNNAKKRTRVVAANIATPVLSASTHTTVEVTSPAVQLEDEDVPEPELEHRSDVGEKGENAESVLSQSKLLHDIQIVGGDAGGLPASVTNSQASKVISDTYEEELREMNRAHHLNDEQFKHLEEELGERVDPDCPLDGTFHQLRRFGNRLWFEGDITLARTCMFKGVELYLNPTNTIEPTQRDFSRKIAPTDDPKFGTVLIESKSMQEKEFEDFGHVVNLIQQRSERVYSLPWQPMRPALHDRMLKEGLLEFDPALRAQNKAKIEQERFQRAQRRKARRKNKGKKAKSSRKKSSKKRRKNKKGKNRKRKNNKGRKRRASRKNNNKKNSKKSRKQKKGKSARRRNRSKNNKKRNAHQKKTPGPAIPSAASAAPKK